MGLIPVPNNGKPDIWIGDIESNFLSSILQIVPVERICHLTCSFPNTPRELDIEPFVHIVIVMKDCSSGYLNVHFRESLCELRETTLIWIERPPDKPWKPRRVISEFASIINHDPTGINGCAYIALSSLNHSSMYLLLRSRGSRYNTAGVQGFPYIIRNVIAHDELGVSGSMC